MPHCWCIYAAPLVPGCCTFSGTIIRKSLRRLFCWSNLLISVWFWLYLDRTRGIVDGFCKWAALAFLWAMYLCNIAACHTAIWITAAASDYACKSVWNPDINQKTKVKKIRVKDSVCICDNPWAFFWPSFCSRRLTERIIARLLPVLLLII